MPRMKQRIPVILFFLIFALLIQNTCPQGFAGKSAVSSASACSHCPHKQEHQPAPNSGKLSIASHSTSHLPIFVLDIPNTQPLFRLAAIATPQPVLPDTYKNAAPDELLHPPRV